MLKKGDLIRLLCDFGPMLKGYILEVIRDQTSSNTTFEANYHNCIVFLSPAFEGIHWERTQDIFGGLSSWIHATGGGGGSGSTVTPVTNPSAITTAYCPIIAPGEPPESTEPRLEVNSFVKYKNQKLRIIAISEEQSSYLLENQEQVFFYRHGIDFEVWVDENSSLFSNEKYEELADKYLLD